MSINISRSILWIIASLLFSIAITGCKKTSGGGWIPVEGGNGKATFGYQASCDNIEHPSIQDFFVGKVSGQFQYKDHGANIAFHGVMNAIPYDTVPELTSCERMAELLAEFGGQGIGLGFPLNSFGMIGTYTPIPKNAGQGGQVSVLAVENENNVCSDGDAVAIQLQGGIHDGYLKIGCLEGGNLTVFSD